jgi:hypothetical protein
MKLIFSNCRTFKFSGLYFSVTYILQNDKHYVVGHKGRISIHEEETSFAYIVYETPPSVLFLFCLPGLGLVQNIFIIRYTI